MRVRVTFKHGSRYGKPEDYTDITEVHYNYTSFGAEKSQRVAIESDILHTGWTLPLSEIDQIEVFEEESHDTV